MGIYKRKQESKKTRKQELDKEKKKTRTRPRKRSRKLEKQERKKELDQENDFLGRVLVFLFSFINPTTGYEGFPNDRRYLNNVICISISHFFTPHPLRPLPPDHTTFVRDQHYKHLKSFHNNYKQAGVSAKFILRKGMVS